MARKLFRKLVDVKTFQESIQIMERLQQAKIPSTYHVYAIVAKNLDFIRILVHVHNLPAAREIVTALRLEAIQ